jgi:hypothetical protein
MKEGNLLLKFRREPEVLTVSPDQDGLLAVINFKHLNAILRLRGQNSPSLENTG